jgi:ATP synthase protein I
MPNPPETREEALESFERKLDALEAKQSSQDRRQAGLALTQGYRLVAELIGGILGGIGFGWLFDKVAHTEPWGLVGGLLIGTAVSTFAVVRAAGRMSDEAKKAAPPPPAVPFDDEDEDY